MWFLSLIFGAVVGLSLGLTGGGGAIFAVPLLVYGLGTPPRQAVGVSLAAVGTVALIGFFGRWRRGQVELATGLVFAAAGMLGAPLGTWAAGLIPETLLLTLFALLMLYVAWGMWRKAARTVDSPAVAEGTEPTTSTCQRDANGRLLLDSPCAVKLGFMGLVCGVLSGLFGIGGGFIIVPALVLLTGMEIRRAIGTSLLVIFLISASGITAHLLAGRPFAHDTALLFIPGGLVGMWAGGWMVQRLSAPMLQRIFAVAMIAVALFMIARTHFAHASGSTASWPTALAPTASSLTATGRIRSVPIAQVLVEETQPSHQAATPKATPLVNFFSSPI